MPHSAGSVRLRSPLCISFVLAAVTFAGRSQIASGQDVPNRADAIEVRTQFLADIDTLHKKFLALANAFPADKYSWRPQPRVRSVGQVFMHVAAELYLFTPLSYGATPSPVVTMDENVMRKFEDMSTKADVLKHLEASYAYAKESVGGVDANRLTGKQKLFGGSYNIIETSLGIGDDMHEHLGQLIAYARMNGITPPWSK